MKKSIVIRKSFRFFLPFISFYKLLQEQKEYVLSKQLLLSSTSIGANINETLAGVSKTDFSNKLAITSKYESLNLCWLGIWDKSQMVKCNIKPFI